MEKYYIEIKNNVPTGPKMNLSFLKKRFLDHDFSAGIPENIVEFIPIEKPEITRFEKIVITLTYADNKVTESFIVRNMTAEEKQIAIEIKRRNFILKTGFASWKYDEDIDQFYAPVSIEDGVDQGVYEWNEELLQWVLKEINEQN